MSGMFNDISVLLSPAIPFFFTSAIPEKAKGSYPARLYNHFQKMVVCAIKNRGASGWNFR